MALDHKKKKKCQSDLFITLTRKFQICVGCDVWQESGDSEIRRLFSCSVNVPLSFHLSTLALTVFPLGCVWLPVSECACHLSIIFSMSPSPSTGLLHRPVWILVFSFSALSISSPLLSFSLNAIILSLQNLALALPIPDGLTYITHFIATL